jgi:hypothetical protein
MQTGPTCGLADSSHGDGHLDRCRLQESISSNNSTVVPQHSDTKSLLQCSIIRSCCICDKHHQGTTCLCQRYSFDNIR